MKKLTLVFLCLLSFGANAQQDQLYSSEGFTTFMHNPASFSNQDLWSVHVLARRHWIGLFDPFQSIQANGGGILPIGEKSLMIGSKYMYKQVEFEYVHNWNISVGLPVQFENSRLTIALAPGLYSMKFDPVWNPPQTQQDSLLGYSRGTVFDLDFGLFYQWQGLYAGLSVTHVTAPRISPMNYRLSPHLYFQAGYRIAVGQHQVVPTLQYRFDGASMILDAMGYFVTKNNYFTIGAGYRLGSTVLVGAAVELKGFRLGYHFDASFSPFVIGVANSHEIRLSYIKRLKKD